ncbi:hypothetical protein Tco_1137893 [Tanacetum coccineum]
MKKTRILARLYGITPTIVLRRNLFKARHVTQQDYGVTTLMVYAVTLLIWKDELSELALRRKPLKDHGFVGYPFDYRVTLGFGSIAGGLDHVNPVIRLPLEHGISRNMSEAMDQEVNSLMQQVADDYVLEVVVGLLQATGHTVAVKRIEKVEGDNSGRRLAELKTHG